MFPCLGKVLYVFVGVFDSLGVVEGVAVVDFLDEIFFFPFAKHVCRWKVLVVGVFFQQPYKEFEFVCHAILPVCMMIGTGRL